MFKIKGLLILLIIFNLTGCSVNKYVNIQEVKSFKKDIKKTYDFIYSTSMYKMSGPNTLFIEHVSFDEVSLELAQECFEATKDWVTLENNLEGIENYLGIKVLKISIEISSQNRYDNWEASYYNHMPNESVTDKTPIDNFKTWYYLE